MSAPLAVLVDGVPVAADWTQDRGLHYGDGLFETMLVRDGRIRFQALHRARFERGCLQLGIPADLPRVWRQAEELAAQYGTITLKLLLTRGTALSRGYTPSGSEQARCVLAAWPAPLATEIPDHVRVATLRATLGENPQLAGLKHCNRLEQILARVELQPLGAFEGLLASSSGQLVSGTMSNVFLQLNGELVTPAVERCGVAGVMRAVVLREALRSGMPVRVAALPLALAGSCGAMFLTNARLGVLPVHELDGRELACPDSIQRLADRVAHLAD